MCKKQTKLSQPCDKSRTMLAKGTAFVVLTREINNGTLLLLRTIALLILFDSIGCVKVRNVNPEGQRIVKNCLL